MNQPHQKINIKMNNITSTFEISFTSIYKKDNLKSKIT
jgi:hypothetical protein